MLGISTDTEPTQTDEIQQYTKRLSVSTKTSWATSEQKPLQTTLF